MGSQVIIKKIKNFHSFLFNLSSMNQNLPDHFETWAKFEGQQKVKIVKESKQLNAGSLTLFYEDHTICNLIQCMLHRDNHVIFVGYRIPHPLKREAIVKIQTDGAKIKNPTDDKEAIWTPLEAFKYALTNLENLLKSLHENFDESNSQQKY